MLFRSVSLHRLALTSAIPLAALIGITPVAARQLSLTLPSMPMRQAIERIAAESGTHIAVDPDATGDLVSSPVRNAGSAEEALRMALRGKMLAVRREKDGSFTVTNDILVVAQPDEAETDLLVRNTTTSSRTGQSLRDQPRNTTVISSKLIAEQQAETVFDALRNAGGVSVNTAAVQGGTSFTVRGFDAGGIVNGLPAASNNGTAAGVTQPIANIERIEVLKGPDALLAGANNLGGTINIVLKKPSAQRQLAVAAETGSFGDVRLTVDANNALSENRLFSARIIAVAASADQNFGGYRGNEDYLLAPSLRFKNARTDIILSVSAANQIFGTTPFTLFNRVTNTPYDLPRDQPILGKDQYTKIGSTRLYGEITQNIGDWLTLVGRGQHEYQRLQFHRYLPSTIDGKGNLRFYNGGSEQRGTADTIDTYARFAFATGAFSHTLTIGYTNVHNDTTSLSSSTSRTSSYNILTHVGTIPAIGKVDTQDYSLASKEEGEYAQYLVKFWKFSVLAGVRHNASSSTIYFPDGYTETEAGKATTPSFGVIFDIARNLSIWGNLSYGYSPTFATNVANQKLPDVRTRNLEGGIKLDLFNNRALINLSYFQLRQSNLLFGDPDNPGFYIAAPGQQGTGIDLDISGEIRRGWNVKAAFTRTIYSYLTPPDDGDVVVGEPRDQYSIYSSYHRDVSSKVAVGFGAGIYGRSSAATDSLGVYSVPSSLQVDVNTFLKFGRLDFNLGVENLFDRKNYNITRTRIYVPLGAPRMWRLTVGYHF